MNQKTRIAAAQFSMSDSMEANYQKALHYIREAAVKGARLVCFPEGQLSQYVPQYEGLDTDGFAVELTHPFVKGLCAACPRPLTRRARCSRSWATRWNPPKPR